MTGTGRIAEFPFSTHAAVPEMFRRGLPRKRRFPSPWSRTLKSPFVSLLLFAASISFLGPTQLLASIVVDHPPTLNGGQASDTDFINSAWQPSWQQLADDFTVGSGATIRSVVWWGFYGSNFQNPPQQPPDHWTNRLRFYDARPTDGKPGEVLYEAFVADPFRDKTGRVMNTFAQPEHIFIADLPTPFELMPDTKYWLEVVEFGLQSSHFRWQTSTVVDATSAVFLNGNVQDWTDINGVTTYAFQLSTVPEPSCLALFALTAVLLRRGCPPRRQRP